MDISQSFQNLLDDVITFIPRALAFLVILIVGWFIARWIGKLVGKGLAKLKLDVAANKSGLRRFTGNYEVSQLLGMLVYFALFLVVLQLSFGVFGPNPVSTLLNDLVAWLPMLFVAIIITVVAFAIAKAVHELIAGTLSHTSYGQTVARVVQAVIIVVGVFAALGQAGIATTVTTPLLWTALAIVAGVSIVGIGGGLIQPMKQRWETVLRTAEHTVRNEGGASGASSSTEQMGRGYESTRYSSGTNVQSESTRAEESTPPESRS
ncbi:mechanosensitive ion channel family protein [Haloglycomyces albus]|uniref:mechanosensitive ion channel family protein n=1 Tax=Haloglycomyces albus TaxID=526067 RepID=UPI00046D0F46|nr:hypothetical protein [Haloglycomyces albus]